jgi:pimeloyl-ACP methyl ester carboxylesterase
MESIYRSEAGKEMVLSMYREILAEWPVTSRQYQVETRHGFTFVIESGETANPPLILLHGSVSNSLTWLGDIQSYAKTHRVFAVDIIGEPGFSAPSRPSYESGAYAEWLSDLLSALELESTSMVGMSLGGWMALNLAVNYPDKIEKLGLICPGGLCRERSSFLVQAVFYTLCGAWGQKQIVKLINGGKLPVDTGLEKAMSFTALTGRHFRPRYAKLPIFSNTDLARLGMPVQVFFGENDYLLRAEASISRLSEQVKNLEAHLLPNTGHVIVNQAPAIKRFLNAKVSRAECIH